MHVLLSKVPTSAELQNLQTQEKEAFSTGISEDTPEILAFRRDLDQLAQKHLREVTTDKATSTNSVNSGSEPANTQPADQDDSDMPELTIFNKPQKGIFDEASYDEEGMVHDLNNLPNRRVLLVPILLFRNSQHHPQSQILGDPKSSVQTRSRVKQTSGAHALEEPKMIFEALKDESWVEAMQEELLYLCVDEFKALVKGRFQMILMGELIYFLDASQDKMTDEFFISQDKYVQTSEKRIDLASVKTSNTPMETRCQIDKR
ncbi:ribonuclease H-like domain-containing protein [Tanacetum coccineum]|uniref:Ribonuclease H-like domain-containing protein n=1 Tax=Tanacetum coccineum TaxID=301880 RepID=A0ABQ5CTC3_9ASTR